MDADRSDRRWGVPGVSSAIDPALSGEVPRLSVDDCMAALRRWRMEVRYPDQAVELARSMLESPDASVVLEALDCIGILLTRVVSIGEAFQLRAELRQLVLGEDPEVSSAARGLLHALARASKRRGE